MLPARADHLHQSPWAHTVERENQPLPQHSVLGSHACREKTHTNKLVNKLSKRVLKS